MGVGESNLRLSVAEQKWKEGGVGWGQFCPVSVWPANPRKLHEKEVLGSVCKGSSAQFQL